MADEDMRAGMFLRATLFFISSCSVFTTQKKYDTTQLDWFAYQVVEIQPEIRLK